MLSNILFNSVDLTSLTNTYFNRIDHHNRPKRNITAAKIARYDGNQLIHQEYAEKEIVIEGFIAAADRSTYETNRDTLLLDLQAQEATLRISQAGANRDYTATVSDIIFSETDGGLGFFSIKFLCNFPFGQDASATTDLNASSNTAATLSPTFTAIGGSYKAQPTLTITVSAVTGGTAKYIKLTNPTTGQYIQITRTWANADALVVNVAARTVTVNGTAVDYTGVFPEFDTTDTTLQYDDNFTTRTVLITMTHKKRYL
jgi:phage-related protein